MIQHSHSWAYMWRKPRTWKDTCTPMFTAALLTIVKTWRQSKCPSTEDWIKILLSHKKELNNAICRKMTGSRDYHTNWSKSDREYQYHMMSHMWNLKNWYKWIYLQNRNRLIDRLWRQSYGYQKGNMGGGIH